MLLPHPRYTPLEGEVLVLQGVQGKGSLHLPFDLGEEPHAHVPTQHHLR